MNIISKKKNKKGVTEVIFGDKKMMVDKVKKITSSNGYMVKPKINPNLKIMHPYDSPMYAAARKSGALNPAKAKYLDKVIKERKEIDENELKKFDK